MVENFTVLYDFHGSIITISFDKTGTLCLLENVAFILCRDIFIRHFSMKNCSGDLNEDWCICCCWKDWLPRFLRNLFS